MFVCPSFDHDIYVDSGKCITFCYVAICRQKQVSRARMSNCMPQFTVGCIITCHGLLWDVITYACPRYLFLVTICVMISKSAHVLRYRPDITANTAITLSENYEKITPQC